MGRRRPSARAYLVELPPTVVAGENVSGALGEGGQIGLHTWLLVGPSRAALTAQLQALGVTATRLTVAAPGIYPQMEVAAAPDLETFLVLWPDGRLEPTGEESPLRTAVLALRTWLMHDFVAADRLLDGEGMARTCFRQLIEHRLREHRLPHR